MSRDFSQTLAASLSGRITYNYPKTRLHGAWERLSTLVMPSHKAPFTLAHLRPAHEERC